MGAEVAWSTDWVWGQAGLWWRLFLWSLKPWRILGHCSMQRDSEITASRWCSRKESCYSTTYRVGHRSQRSTDINECFVVFSYMINITPIMLKHSAKLQFIVILPNWLCKINIFTLFKSGLLCMCSLSCWDTHCWKGVTMALPAEM